MYDIFGVYATCNILYMLYASSGKTKPRPQEPTFDNPNVHHLVRLAFWNKFKFKLLTFIIYVLLCCEYLETTDTEPPDWRALYSRLCTSVETLVF